MNDGTCGARVTLRLLMERASCRNFTAEKIPPDVLREVLEAGIQAPTGGNLQPYSIIKIEDQATKERLAELCEDQPFIARAPVDLLFCIDLHRLERWAALEAAPFTARKSFRHFWIAFQDTVMCAQNACTAADALGLGSVYVGSVLECFRELREMFSLPDGVFPVVLLCLGYPAKEPRPSRRLGVEVVVHNEAYREIDDARLVEAFREKYPTLKVVPTPERLREISDVCRAVAGKTLADECLARIQAQGFINVAQRYFGLHYRADLMSQGNREFLQTLRDFGFEWVDPAPDGTV
ncbi:MAG: nitroreductase family protein [Betaproteobacteria bacterium]